MLFIPLVSDVTIINAATEQEKKYFNKYSNFQKIWFVYNLAETCYSIAVRF